MPPHSAFPITGKTNKQKPSTNLNLYEAHTNHWTNLRRAETKRRKNSTFFKEIILSLKKGRIQIPLKPGKRRPQTQWLRKKNNENSHKGNHCKARPGITQPPIAPCAGCLIKTTTTARETKIQTQSSADRITISLSLPIRGKTNRQTKKVKLSTNLTLTQTYTNHWTISKKEFNLEAWEEETSNTIS